MAASAAVGVAVGLTATGCSSKGQAKTPSAYSCHTVKGPFHTSGDQVLTSNNGAQFIAYGMTVSGLQNGYSQITPTDMTDDLLRIDASVSSWCVNTIRLQLQQSNLVDDSGNPAPHAAEYLADIHEEVAEAEKYGMVVALNDQTEASPSPQDFGPTEGTIAFWHKLDAVYASDPQIVLDVFNEPRVELPNTDPVDCTQNWPIWQNGGNATINGTSYSYLGMQQVVNAVRDTDHAHNLIWAEGPCWAGTLSHAQEYALNDPDHALAYDFHHPAGPAESPHTPREWNGEFGYLVANKFAPVVDGEWTNRSAGNTTNCWEDAPTAVPAYLAYMASMHIGIVGFQLVNEFLLQSKSMKELADANSIDSNWQCDDPAIDEGAGTLLMHWLKQYNSA